MLFLFIYLTDCSLEEETVRRAFLVLGRITLGGSVLFQQSKDLSNSKICSCVRRIALGESLFLIPGSSWAWAIPGFLTVSVHRNYFGILLES